MAQSDADAMIGRLIDGRYQVDSRIARGGMATVYLATDLRLERQVAVKIMHGHLADDSAFRTRFIQEARSAARLAHPNVVSVFDQGQDSDMAYLVMEYLPGITLRDLLKDFGKLTPEQTVDVMDSVLRGLAAAHEAGIVHRDVKLENILLRRPAPEAMEPVLADLGLVAVRGRSDPHLSAARLGTLLYNSPEANTLDRHDYTEAGDVWALGIILYLLLSGTVPLAAVRVSKATLSAAMPSAGLPSWV